MRNNPSKGDSVSVFKWIKPVLLSTAIGLLCTSVLLMIFAFVLTLQDLPQGAILPIAIFAMAVGTFLSGYLSARIVGKKGLMCGFLSGLFCYLILAIVSLSVMHFTLDAAQGIKLAVALVTSCFGGIVGVNASGRRKI